MAVQKLSSKNQIVIPKEARQAMDANGGDELLVVVKDNLTLVMPKPKRYARTIQGLAKGMYPSGYLKQQRWSRWGLFLKDLPTERERISLDTNSLIYFLENHLPYRSWYGSLFDLIEQGHNPAVTSTVTLLELLVQPYCIQQEELRRRSLPSPVPTQSSNWCR